MKNASEMRIIATKANLKSLSFDPSPENCKRVADNLQTEVTDLLELIQILTAKLPKENN